MKSSLLKILASACVAALLLPATVQAETHSSLNPKALAVLKRMSDALAAAKAFTYQSRSALELPARNGQFLTFISTANVALKRPNLLRAIITGETPHFNFYYDGSTVSALAPDTNVFSITKAPPTIDDMLPALEDETGIRFVTAPLLLSNPYRTMVRGMTSAIVVGPSLVHGTACEHLAFQSPGVNWEIWIETGSRSLPRRLAVTFTDRPKFPRTLVEFSNWNLRPWLNARDFVFHKPDGAKEIPFHTVWNSVRR